MTGAEPVRVIRSRLKGSRLESPNGLPVVCVSRGTRWGNPYKLVPIRGISDDFNRRRLVAAFRDALVAGKLPVSVADVKRELRGKNLACWCKIGLPCHADVLLEIANA